MLLSENFSVVATKNATKSALRYLGKETTYALLKNQIARLSYLYQNEFGKGVKEARIAFLTNNSPSCITAFFAFTNNRVPVIPIDPELAPEVIIDWLKESGATHLAITSDLLSKARDVLHAAHLNLPIIEIEKKQGGEYDTSYSPASDNKPLESDIVLVVRSSGTSGKPKFINLTHKQIYHATMSLRGIYCVSPTDRFVSTMNWCHPFSFIHHVLFPLMTGAACVIDHGLINADFLDFILDSRVSRLIGTPPFFLKLLVNCKNDKRLLPGIKSITVGLGPLLTEVKKTFDLLKISVCHTYGQAENVWTIAMEEVPAPDTKPDQAEYRIGQVGRGLAGLKYKVIDSNGEKIEGDEVRRGMLCVSGPSVMSGYLGLESETKQKLRGSWLYTGDMAELVGKDDSLRIIYLGRKEDYLESDGDSIELQEIDRALKKIPGIEDAAAFVLSLALNPKERVLACAVVKVTGSPLSEKAIIEACNSLLASNLIPKAFTFTDVIPRDSGGNVICTRLRNQFSGIGG